jgi:hypothetical protein
MNDQGVMRFAEQGAGYIFTYIYIYNNEPNIQRFYNYSYNTLSPLLTHSSAVSTASAQQSPSP